MSRVAMRPSAAVSTSTAPNAPNSLVDMRRLLNQFTVRSSVKFCSGGDERVIARVASDGNVAADQLVGIEQHGHAARYRDEPTDVLDGGARTDFGRRLHRICIDVDDV